MPRGFSEAEQERIQARLIDAGRDLFSRLGLSKTSIAELARAAGIGKGSFYRFFDSKEALFFALQEQLERDIRARMTAELELLESTPHAMLQRFFGFIFETLERHPELALLTRPENLDHLLRKLGPERLAAHQRDDTAFFEALLARWHARGILVELPASELSALARACFVLSLNRNMIGEEAFSAIRERFITSLADSLLPQEL